MRVHGIAIRGLFEMFDHRIPLFPSEPIRLLDVRHQRPYHGRPRPSESAVKRCSDDLIGQIKSKLAESATLSQSLERTFPARVISAEGPSPFSEQQIREQLSEVDESRSRLVEASLLDRAFEPALRGEQFDDTTKRVLPTAIRGATAAQRTPSRSLRFSEQRSESRRGGLIVPHSRQVCWLRWCWPVTPSSTT